MPNSGAGASRAASSHGETGGRRNPRYEPRYTVPRYRERERDTGRERERDIGRERERDTGREREREAPVDFSRAPPPAQKKREAAVSILVRGDANADWLAYGLEDAYAEK